VKINDQGVNQPYSNRAEAQIECRQSSARKHAQYRRKIHFDPHSSNNAPINFSKKYLVPGPAIFFCTPLPLRGKDPLPFSSAKKLPLGLELDLQDWHHHRGKKIKGGRILLA